jgi:hypothetical protein
MHIDWKKTLDSAKDEGGRGALWRVGVRRGVGRRGSAALAGPAWCSAALGEQRETVFRR